MFITSSTNSWLEFILNKECFGGAGGIFFFGNAFLSYKYRKNICEKEPCKDNLITGRRLKFIVSLQLFSMYADNTSYILLTFLHTKHFFSVFPNLTIFYYFINIVIQVYHYFLFHIFVRKKQYWLKIRIYYGTSIHCCENLRILAFHIESQGKIFISIHYTVNFTYM